MPTQVLPQSQKHGDLLKAGQQTAVSSWMGAVRSIQAQTHGRD